MPRKSTAAKMTPTVERARLEPPTTIGLSTRERQIFRDVVNSVRPEHFAAEDAPLIALYARGLAQCELAARELASGSTDKFFLDMQSSGLKVVDVMTRKLRLGVLARSPHNQRGRRGTTEPITPMPWADNPRLHAVRRDDGGADGERRFADLRARAGERRAVFRVDTKAAMVASEAPDVASFRDCCLFRSTESA